MDLGFEIGEPDTGRQHIHLHFDGSDEYEIAYEETHAVELEPGSHSVVAVVANGDHSETDVQSPEVTFEVGEAGAGGSDSGGDSGGSDGTPAPAPDTGSDGFDY
jgi:hypothetical protein